MERIQHCTNLQPWGARVSQAAGFYGERTNERATMYGVLALLSSVVGPGKKKQLPRRHKVDSSSQHTLHLFTTIPSSSSHLTKLQTPESRDRTQSPSTRLPFISMISYGSLRRCCETLLSSYHGSPPRFVSSHASNSRQGSLSPYTDY